jgi:prevent-host-death family protein
MEFNVHQAKAQVSKLLDLAQEGEEVLIVRNGKPVAELIPARRKGALTLGAARGTLLTSTSRDWRPWNGPTPTHMTAFCAREFWWKERS